MYSQGMYHHTYFDKLVDKEISVHQYVVDTAKKNFEGFVNEVINGRSYNIPSTQQRAYDAIVSIIRLLTARKDYEMMVVMLNDLVNDTPVSLAKDLMMLDDTPRLLIISIILAENDVDASALFGIKNVFDHKFLDDNIDLIPLMFLLDKRDLCKQLLSCYDKKVSLGMLSPCHMAEYYDSSKSDGGYRRIAAKFTEDLKGYTLSKYHKQWVQLCCIRPGLIRVMRPDDDKHTYKVHYPACDQICVEITPKKGIKYSFIKIKYIMGDIMANNGFDIHTIEAGFFPEIIKIETCNS